MPSKGSITPRLVIIEGKDKGKVIPLTDGTVVIGRTKGDVLVTDPRMSRSHVALHFDAKSGKLTFTDLKSLNKTLLNGEAKETGDLNDGDKIQLGDTTFDCQLAPAEEAPKPRKEEKKEKEKEKAKAKAKGTEDIPIAEPSAPPPPEPAMPVAPMAVSADVPPEPQLPEAPAPPPPRRPSLVAMAKSGYSRFPKRVRVYGLIAGLLAMLVFYVKVPNFGGGSDVSVEREATEIQTLEAQGKIEEALAKATELKDKNPKSSLAWLTLGNMYMAVKKNEQAIAAFQRAKELPPPQPVAHVRLIRVYLLSQLNAEAEEELSKLEFLITKEEVHTKELFVETAQLFLDFKELKQPPQKAIILAKALQTDLAPDSTIGYKLEAQVLFNQNRAQEALPVLEKGIELDPADDWLLEYVAYAKLSLKDIPGANTAVDAWLKAKPQATRALLVKAYLAVKDGNYLASLPYVQKILQIAGPNNAAKDAHYSEALHLLGQIYEQQSQPTEALNSFRQSCEAGFQNACERLTQSPNGTAPGGATPNGTVPGGVAPNGGAPNGAVSNGTALNGALPNGAAPSGGVSPTAPQTDPQSPAGGVAVSPNGAPASDKAALPPPGGQPAPASVDGPQPGGLDRPKVSPLSPELVPPGN